MKWYDKQRKAVQDKLDQEQSIETSFEIEKELDDNISPLEGNTSNFNEEDSSAKMLARESISLEGNQDDMITANPADSKHSFNIEEDLQAVEEEDDSTLGTTTISNETQLLGNIEMRGHLIIYGIIIGNVDCSGDVSLYGKVEGNIVCKNVIIDHAIILGDIDCKRKVEIKGDSDIKGNTIANELYNAGTIIGNITVSQGISLTSTSHVEGTVCARTLETQEGASLIGQFTIVNEEAK